MTANGSSGISHNNVELMSSFKITSQERFLRNPFTFLDSVVLNTFRILEYRLDFGYVSIHKIGYLY